jgi:hypothetical protein
MLGSDGLFVLWLTIYTDLASKLASSVQHSISLKSREISVPPSTQNPVLQNTDIKSHLYFCQSLASHFQHFANRLSRLPGERAGTITENFPPHIQSALFLTTK